MKLQIRLQPVLVALTIANFALLVFLLAQTSAVAAPTPGDGILRGKGLELVDGAGTRRATIELIGESRQPDGSVYPDTVLLRLITPDGRPTVKLAATADGSGMSLADGQGLSYVQMLARGDKPEFNIVDKAGKKATALP